MKNIKGILPGMFTMGNLACGFISIILSGGASSLAGESLNRNLSEAAWLIIMAAFLDFLDGLVARFSNTSSRFGVELDSLADIVSFGVAPAVMVVSFSLIHQTIFSWLLAFVFLMAGSFRLARFNLSAKLEQKVNFLGLPIPSAAIAIVSYVLFSIELWGSVRMEKFFIILIMSSAVLMVSTIEFETMPRFDFSKPKNIVKVMGILVMAAGLTINASLVIFPFTMLYIIYSVAKMIVSMFSAGSFRPRAKLEHKA